VRRYPLERPDSFELNTDNQLATGLVFAGLGRHANSTHFRDSSLYGNHGTGNYAVPATATSGWAWDNLLGRWVTRFNGSTDYVVCSRRPTSSGTFTISGWAQHLASGNNVIAGWGAQYASLFVTGSSGQVGLMVDNSNSGGFWGDGTWSDQTKPHHFSLLQYAAGAGATSELYLDGVSKGTVTSGAYSTIAPTSFYLGRPATSLWLFNGIQSDLLFHSRLLSAAEIQQLADPMISGLILPPKRKIWAAVTGEAPAAFKPYWAQRQRQTIGGGVI
jgi:hypothetical protein